MRKSITILTLCFFCSIMSNAAAPVKGKLVRIEAFASKYVDARNIDIWLPSDYQPSKRYNVLYMHDGQMLYDTAYCWNKKEWMVDETMDELLSGGKIGPTIVVGIWNNGSKRIAEYLPTKIFDLLEQPVKQKVTEKFLGKTGAIGDQYLRFIAEELKPYIDKHYSVYTDRNHTFMMGSSMGGIISMYAICEYPQLFSGVACLSTAWLSQVEPNYAIPLATFEYLKKSIPTSLPCKIYCDYGTGESDNNYILTQDVVNLIFKGKGYNDTNFMSKVYSGAIHDEIAWSRRLNIPITFMISSGVK